MQGATAARHRTGQVRHELVPRLFRRPERAEDAARDHRGPTLLDATHRQTQVLRLDHDADAIGVQSILQEVGDLALVGPIRPPPNLHPYSVGANPLAPRQPGVRSSRWYDDVPEG